MLEGAALEDLVQDVGHLLLGENTAVGLAREEPEPGHPLDMVFAIPRFAAARRKLVHVAVEESLLRAAGLIVVVDAERHLLPDHVLGIDSMVGGFRLKAESEEARHFLVPGE